MKNKTCTRPLWSVQLWHKIKGTALRAGHAVWLIPRRAGRLCAHVGRGVKGLSGPVEEHLPANRFVRWWTELAFLCLDLLALPEWYETLTDWVKWETRPLTSKELALARSVFGASIPYGRVRVDERATVACRRYGGCYVGFFTINSWGRFGPTVFIHEMMHVWQFHQMGSVYILRALLAQRTTAGYNYGGTEALARARATGHGLRPFNLEQQADIVSDYYCLREGLPPRWCNTRGQVTLELFEYFIKIIKNKEG